MQYDDIKEAYKEFQKDRHADDKKKHFNEMQEVFAQGELFDTSRVTRVPDSVTGVINEQETDDFYTIQADDLKHTALPFPVMFIHTAGRQYTEHGNLLKENLYLYAHEYSPTIITGSLYSLGTVYKRNLPFIADTESGTIQINKKGFEQSKHVFNIKHVTSYILAHLFVVGNMNKRKVLIDIPTKPKTDYYIRKGKETIKVPARNIYYIIDKEDTESEHKIKATGRLEYSHAFRVRGHWRSLPNPDRFGKDRAGARIVKGYTWVSEYIKNKDSPTLVKKLRVIE